MREEPAAEADKQEAQADQERVNAAKQCKAERSDSGFAAAHGGKSFAEYYGTNRNNRNAFGKCVSRKASGGAGQYTEQQS